MYFGIKFNLKNKQARNSYETSGNLGDQFDKAHITKSYLKPW